MAIFDAFNIRLPGGSGTRRPVSRAEAEDYAASLGLRPGGPGWGDAIRGFVLNARGAPAEPHPSEASLPPSNMLASSRHQPTASRPQRMVSPAAKTTPPISPEELDAIRTFLGARSDTVQLDTSVAGRFRKPESGQSPTASTTAEPSFEDEWQALLAVEGGIEEDGTFKTSRAGAVGPAQIRPKYGPEYAKRAGLPWDEHRARTDRAYNEALGRAYYAQLRGIFDAPTAAAAYNDGPYGMSTIVAQAANAGHPDDWEQYVPIETREHARKFREKLGMPAGDMPKSAWRRKKAKGAPAIRVILPQP